jgi:dipeptide/tripeptide permease
MGRKYIIIVISASARPHDIRLQANEAAAPEAGDMSEGHPKRGNVAILSVCQALAMAAGSIDMTLTALTGYQLAPDKLLATLPFSLITVAGAFVTFSASMLMKRIGRKLGFMLGATVGTLGVILSFWEVLLADLWVF